MAPTIVVVNQNVRSWRIASPRAADVLVWNDRGMPWRDWSDYRRAQTVNAATVALFLAFAVSMWAAVFVAAALVNTAGGLWRARQEHRRLRDRDSGKDTA